jgi:hypothetical protein
MKELTLEVLEQAITEYQNKEGWKNNFHFPVHHTGTAEDGTRYSYWDFGGMITGDGGYELFVKEMQKIGDNLEM